MRFYRDRPGLPGRSRQPGSVPPAGRDRRARAGYFLLSAACGAGCKPAWWVRGAARCSFPSSDGRSAAHGRFAPSPHAGFRSAPRAPATGWSGLREARAGVPADGCVRGSRRPPVQAPIKPQRRMGGRSSRHGPPAGRGRLRAGAMRRPRLARLLPPVSSSAAYRCPATPLRRAAVPRGPRPPRLFTAVLSP